MDNKPLFSILIANFNNGIFFKDCYKSIMEQTYPNWEVIIVDDCSTDNSLSLIKDIVKGNPKFKIYLNSQNKGCGFTKRKCVENAKGEICAFLDPDDRITKDAIKLMVNMHNKFPKASLIYSNIFICNESLEIQYEYKRTQVNNNDPFFTNIGGPISCFCSFKLDLYKKTTGINSNLPKAVDQDQYLKLYEVGDAIHIDKTLYYYRNHKNSISLGEKNRNKAFFWHWKVLFDTADRRGVDFSEKFYTHFLRKKDYDQQLNEYKNLKSNLFFRLLKKLNIF